MRRRELITLLGGAAAAWPLAALAQQPALPVIGYLITRSQADFAGPLAAFQQGLQQAGFIEGRNVTIEYRFADDRYEQLPVMVADLVQRQVSVIAVDGFPAAAAAKAATTTIPIVFYVGGDAVSAGLVASLNRPGGNLTGIVNMSVELVPKWLELLHQALPVVMAVALLVNPSNPNADAVKRGTEAAARNLGLMLHVLKARSEREIEVAFESLQPLHVGGLLISPDGLFVSQIERLAGLTLKHRMPAITSLRDFAAAGGLMSYGGSVTEATRLVGGYTGRILNGEKPADLPVQQYNKVDLIINLKTAKALGIDLPLPLLGRADEVIE